MDSKLNDSCITIRYPSIVDIMSFRPSRVTRLRMSPSTCKQRRKTMHASPVKLQHTAHVWHTYWLTHTHTHSLNGPLSGTTRLSRYQKGDTSLDFTEARNSEWQWHQLGHMQVCTSLQTDNHASTPPLKFFLQAGCPSCCPTNSIKALKAFTYWLNYLYYG